MCDSPQCPQCSLSLRNFAETGTEGPSAAAAQHNLQSREEVAKELEKNKNPVGNFTTNIYDAEPKALIRIW